MIEQLLSLFPGNIQNLKFAMHLHKEEYKLENKKR